MRVALRLQLAPATKLMSSLHERTWVNLDLGQLQVQHTLTETPAMRHVPHCSAKI